MDLKLVASDEEEIEESDGEELDEDGSEDASSEAEDGPQVATDQTRDPESIFQVRAPGGERVRWRVEHAATRAQAFRYVAALGEGLSWESVVDYLRGRGLLVPGENGVRVGAYARIDGRSVELAQMTRIVKVPHPTPRSSSAPAMGVGAPVLQAVNSAPGGIPAGDFERLLRALEVRSAPPSHSSLDFAQKVLVPLLAPTLPILIQAWLSRPNPIDQFKPIIEQMVMLAQAAGKGEAAADLEERFAPLLERLQSTSNPTNWGELIAAIAPQVLSVLGQQGGATGAAAQVAAQMIPAAAGEEQPDGPPVAG